MASMPVPCPQCGLVLKAPLDASGRKARCKKCGQKFRIPAGDSNLAAEPIAEGESIGDSLMLSSVIETSTFPKPYKPRSGSARSPLKWALAIAGFVVVALGILWGAGEYRKERERSEQAKSKLDEAANEKAANEAREPRQRTETAKKEANEKKLAQQDSPEAKAERADLTTLPAAKASKTVMGSPAPPAPNAGAKSITKPANAIAIPFEPSAVRRLIVNATMSRVAVVRRTFDGFQGKGAIDTVDTYVFPSGRKLASLEVTTDFGDLGAIAIGPGEGHIVAETKPGRVTVWDSLNGKKVFDDVELVKAKGTTAAFANILLSETHLTAIEGNGAIVRFPFMGENPTPSNTFDGKTLGPSFVARPNMTFAAPNDSRIVVYLVGDKVYVVPLEVGQPRIDFTFALAPVEVFALAVDPGGNRIATVYRAANGAVRVVLARLGNVKPLLATAFTSGIGLPLAATWHGEMAAFRTDEGAYAFFDGEGGGFIGVVRPATSTKLGGSSLYPSGDRLFSLDLDSDSPKQFRLLDLEFPFDGLFFFRDRAVDRKAPFSFLFTPEGLAP